MSSNTFSSHIIYYHRSTLKSKFVHNFRACKMKHVDPGASLNNITSKGTRFNKTENEINDYFDGVETVFKAKNKRRMPKTTMMIAEHVLNVSETTTKEQIVQYCDWLETKGYYVLNFVLHKDEGKDVQNGEINYHVHVLATPFKVKQVGDDWEVVNYRKKIDKAVFRDMQSKGAEIFNMQRGISKTITKRRHIPSDLYRNLQMVESAELDKALEVMDIKSLEKILKEKIKEMKAKSTEVLKENKAGRPFYTRKEQIFYELENEFKLLIKTIKKGVKSKNYVEVNQTINKLFKTVLDASDSLGDLYQDLLKFKTFDYDKLIDDFHTVTDDNFSLRKENQELKSKIKQQKPQHSPTQNTVNAITSINYEIEKPIWLVAGQARANKLYNYLFENRLIESKYRNYLQNFLMDKNNTYIKQVDLIDSFKAYVKKMEAPKVNNNTFDFGL